MRVWIWQNTDGGALQGTEKTPSPFHNFTFCVANWRSYRPASVGDRGELIPHPRRTNARTASEQADRRVCSSASADSVGAWG